jgi:CO/xanthine dehydrogenase Mo-binding subunit
MLVIEEIMDRVARRLGLPPEVVRERNLYHGTGETNRTHYREDIGDNRLQAIWAQAKAESQFAERREALAAWNAAHPRVKRGLAITPLKFGISFTLTHYNQAGAYVLIYAGRLGAGEPRRHGDGAGALHEDAGRRDARARGEGGVDPHDGDGDGQSAQHVAHGGVERGGPQRHGGGGGVRDVARAIGAGGGGVAWARRGSRWSLPVVRRGCGARDVKVPFAQVCAKAYLDRVSLAATGFYKTPGIQWDWSTSTGRPFHYFACGAAVAEVEVDGYTA